MTHETNGTGPPNGFFSGPLVNWVTRPFQVDLSPRQNFEGQTILVVFNSNARQGAFKPYADSLKTSLQEMGFRVEFLPTAADPVERLAKIRGTASNLLRDPSVKGLHLFPVGGDGTIDQVVGQVMREITGPFEKIPHDSKIDEVVRQKLAAVTVAQVGTAADIANQVSAPPSSYRLRSFARSLFLRPPPPPFAKIPDFMARAQRIPMGIGGVVAPEVSEQTIFHSVGFGTSGYLFTQAEENRRGNSKNPFNRGLLSYFRVLPKAISDYGFVGFDVEIKHHDRVDRFRVGDVLGTSSRIIAASGGIPGGWGEFKLIAIPNGLSGMLTMTESMIRGLGTKLGFNWVGADSVFWTLPASRQITLRPGEVANLRFFEPDSQLPRMLPWQVNGDSVPTQVDQAKIYVPPVSVPIHADPRSVAVRLYYGDQLRRGLSEFSNQPEANTVFQFLPKPFVKAEAKGKKIWASPFYPTHDLRAFSSDKGIEGSRLPMWILRAHGVGEKGKVPRFEENPKSMHDLQNWSQTPKASEQFAADRRLLEDNFANRFQSRGFGILGGMGSFYLANHFLQSVGIDSQRDRFVHFNTSALVSNVVNQSMNGASAVLANRLKGMPYDWATMETKNVQGLLASRFIYETEPSLIRAMGLGALRNLGVQGGLRSVLQTGAKSLVTVPVNTAWGMGGGLAASRATDLLMTRHFPDQPELREKISGVAFFAPSIYSVMAGRKAFAVLESSTMKKVSFAFSAGFMADIVYAGAQSVLDQEEADYHRYIQHRASDLKGQQESRGTFSLATAFELVSPELSAWWQSHDWYNLKPNEYYQQVLTADREVLEDSTKALKSVLMEQLLYGVGNEAQQEFFYETVNLDLLHSLQGASEVENKIMAFVDLRKSPQEWACMEDAKKVAYIQSHFSGYQLREDEVIQMVRRMRWEEVRSRVFQISKMGIPNSESIRYAFDNEGNVSTLIQERLLRFVAPNETALTTKVLEARKQILHQRLEELNARVQSGDVSVQIEYDRLKEVAAKVFPSQ